MASETKILKVKSSTTQDGSSKGRPDSLVVKKKIDSSRKLPIDSKMKSVTTKSEVSVLKFGTILYADCFAVLLG